MELKRIPILLFTLVFLGLQSSPAQQHQTYQKALQGQDDSIIRCGAMDVYERQMRNDSMAQERRERIEQHVRDYMREHPNGGGAGRASVIKIPIVFHVVYNNASENIADAQVLSQLDVLNEDFRRLNSDTSDTRSQFDSVATDVEIEFCLAQRDPNGNATNGITRTSTSHGTFSTNDDVKYDSQGGKDAWPASDYLNFWVCNLGGGLLGYAQFPGNGPAATDGVVVNYENVGDTLNVSAPYDMGRTGTHEVGHWLNLFHTFQDGCSGTSPSTCASAGDRCCDTPPIQSSSSGCPTPTQNTCSETPDRVDQWENYMDYTEDACMNMFSEDQKTRMRALFAPGGARESLKSSQGCVPPNAWDVAISEILVPSGTLCQSSFDPEIVLSNNGSNQLDSVDIEYNIDGSGTQSYSWSGTLNSGQSDTITLPTLSSSSGSHTFEAYTLPNSLNGSNADQFQGNDTASSNFTIVSGGTNVTVTIETDCWGSETTWELLDSNGTVVGSGGPYTDQSGGGLYTQTLTCLAYGCYDFKIRDSFGDGMYGSQYGSCSVDGDFYLLDDQGDTLTQMSTANAAFGDSSVKNFCLQDPFGIDSVDVADLACNGGSDGRITVYPTGSDYEYSNDNGATYQDSNSFNGLTAGSYDVILRDTSSGASDTTQVVVNEPPVLAIDSLDASDPSCGDGDGSIIVNASGGVSPYSYSKDNGSTFQSSDSFTGLSAGTYNIVVEDDSGCTASSSVTLDAQPAPTGLSFSLADDTCAAGNGEVNITGVTGGTSPYQYDFDGSGYSNQTSYSGLTSGTYSVTVKDDNGCTYTEDATINDVPGPSNLSFNVSDADCGSANGQVDITGTTGGSSPYEYRFDGGAWSTNTSYSNLSGGSYTVEVRDANGCIHTDSVNVGSIGGPTDISFTLTDDTCAAAIGELEITGVTGGNSPYQYDFDGSGYSNQTSYSGLGAGTYSVTVKDDSGCAYTENVTLNNVSGPSGLSFNVSDANCGDADGAVSIAGVTGGTSPYAYRFDGGAWSTSTSYGSLSPGSYTVEVRDDNGCTYTESVNVGSIGGPTDLSFSIADDTCSGGQGELSITGVTGGSSPYQYDFDGSGYSNQTSYSGLAAGTYSVTVKDDSGCTYTEDATINNVAGPSELSVQVTDATCDRNDGELKVTDVGGGTSPYRYELDGNGYSERTTYDKVSVGEHVVTVKDSNGCTLSDTAEVGDTVTPSCLDIPTVITPNGDGMNDSWNIQGLEAFETVQVRVFNRWGSKVFESSDPNEEWDGTHEGKELPETAYHYVIVLNDGEKELKGQISIVR